MQVVGESIRPLSGREIEKRWYSEYRIRPFPDAIKSDNQPKILIDENGKRKYKKEKSHGDIYRIIKTLAGFPSGKPIFLCNWKMISPLSAERNQEDLKILINKIRKLLGVDPIIFGDKDNIETNLQDDLKNRDISLVFAKSRRGENSQEIIMQIKIYPYNNVRESKLEIPEIVDISVFWSNRKQSRELALYLFEDDTAKGKFRYRIPFIQHKLSESAMNKITNLHKGMKSTNFRNVVTNEIIADLNFYWPQSDSDVELLQEIQKIRNDPRNFVYFLSLEGFLLYLLQADNTEKISKVIRSLNQNEYAKNEFPFLWNYDIFDDIYGPKEKIRLLKEIASELQSQLVTSDRDSLLNWIIKRIHFTLIYSRSFPGTGPIYKNSFSPYWRQIIKSVNERKNEKNRKLIDQSYYDQLACELCKYDRKILSLLKIYQEKDLSVTEALLKD